MSSRDHEQYGPMARAFVGRRVFQSVAADAMKLLVDKREGGADYVWVDPPWSLLSGRDVIMRSEDVPRHNEPDYKRRFQEYCAVAACLDGAALRDVVYTSGSGETEFVFDGGIRLLVPDKPLVGDAAWYEHWYVNLHDSEAGGR